MTATSNARIRTMDMPILDEVFVMGDGFVLNCFNRTFAEFFREELQVDIDHPRWETQSGSKAKTWDTTCDRWTGVQISTR